MNFGVHVKPLLMKKNILLVDDHELFLEALEMIINLEEDCEVVGKLNNGKELLGFLKSDTKPTVDVVVLDINMPELDGIEALSELEKIDTDFQIIILSSMSDTRIVHEAMKKGAQGFLSKKCARKEIIQAIHSVCNGEAYFGETINKEILLNLTPGKRKKKQDDPFMLNQLTDREMDVLKLIALEYTSKEISEQLFIAQSTVDTHRKNIIEKLKVKNSVGLGKIAVMNNLI